MQPIFITGIGTDVGKTVASAIVAEALQAYYWKPIQAGFDKGTDALTVKDYCSDAVTIVPEVYKLVMPASPHIAARAENTTIDIEKIVAAYQMHISNLPPKPFVIEGAGGLLVPINEHAFVLDIIKALQAKVILVSRNYLGSINHSLLTVAVCKQHQIEVAGWLFNDQYLNYEDEIVQWTGIPKIGSIATASVVDATFVQAQAKQLATSLQTHL
ncbi:MAG TPA: dethiobiotin synthase [Chitinophagaceae bacterium]|nr:dethiobiotin synthase [Chitinophagaceae bacterium]HAN38754.1 dethiobiotin synthase [Chitinophagaceae bacterium]